MSMCIDCTVFYANDDCNDKCSMCFKKDQPIVTNMTLDELLAHNGNTMSGAIYESNLKKLFKHYASEKLKNGYILINTLSKYQTFRNIVDPYIKPYGDFRSFMFGNNEYPVVLLTAKYADMLLLDLEKIISHSSFFAYVHQIANRTIDIWNIESKNNVLLCYHKNFGDFVECPNNYAELETLWNKHNSRLYA